MEFGQDQLRTFVTISEVLGVSLVALICELLRRNNEELRVKVRELVLHRDGEKKEAAVPAPAAPVTPRVQEPRKAPRESNRAMSPAALAAVQRGIERAAAPRPPKVRTLAAPPITLHMTSAPAQPVKVDVPQVKRDWNALLSRTAPTPAPATTFPAGFHDGFVLSQLVQRHQPVSGLVVSIGLNSVQPNGSGQITPEIRTLIQSLIGPQDFACQSARDEFLLIYPGERGASAQRRLNQIAQQLWDFQLQAMGALSILFSWGGVEVRSESIEEAVASASERMQETKRGRKLLTLENHGNVHELRQAV
jgi:hypothetical protein